MGRVVCLMMMCMAAYCNWKEGRPQPGPQAPGFLTDLPAPDSLVRASAEPVQEPQAVLLRAATESVERHEEQLVRAAGGMD